MEITNNQDFERFALEYAVRFNHCKPFHLNDLYQHCMSMNKVLLGYKLDDLCLAKKLLKRGDNLYQGIDNRSDSQKVMAQFSSLYEWHDVPELSRMLKMRDDHVKNAVQELVNDGLLEKCIFIPGSYWVKINSTNN